LRLTRRGFLHGVDDDNWQAFAARGASKGVPWLERVMRPSLCVLAFLPMLISPIEAKERAVPNNLFTLSGFVVKYGDSPERLAVLRSLPANKLVARSRGGKTYFVYAEPNGCVCAFVGTPESYARYRNGGVGSGYGDVDPSGPHRVDQMMDDIRPADAASAAMDYIFGPGR
jgi:hypothetical protein